jgi:hypothetical protein
MGDGVGLPCMWSMMGDDLLPSDVHIKKIRCLASSTHVSVPGALLASRSKFNFYPFFY